MNKINVPQLFKIILILNTLSGKIIMIVYFLQLEANNYLFTE